MKVILTDDVVGLGDIGEAVSVKAGYARNFLIPKGMAFESSSASAKTLNHKMRQVNAKRAQLKDQAESRAGSLRGLVVKLELRATESGRVFGSISARDIATKLTEMGHETDRRRVMLTDSLKKLGEHTVPVKLHQDVVAEIKVVVAPRTMTRAEEEAEVGSFKQSFEDTVAEKAEAAEASETGAAE